MYYDLAKLNHSLTMNHEILAGGHFHTTFSASGVEVDIFRKASLVECSRELLKFLEEEGYDARQVEILTAIIWINMAPLHEHPLDVFLYYYGRYSLSRALSRSV